MSNSNQEIIEARLATYIDGELDPAEQIEIEAHLEQNPQYRRLVEDLRKTREMLRCVPREAAPPELAEAFNSQLERSVLLAGPGKDDQPRMRIGAFPRMFAAAAIVLLTFGLATIVYFVLPGHGGKIVAIGGPASAPKHVEKPSDTDAKEPAAPKDLPGEIVKGAKDHNPVDQPSSSLTPAEIAAGLNSGKTGGLAAAVGDRPDALAKNEDKDSRAGTAVAFGEARRKVLEQRATDASQDPQVIDALAADVAGGRLDNAPVAASHALVMVVRSNDLKRVQQALDDSRVSVKIDLQRSNGLLNSALGRSNPTGEQLAAERDANFKLADKSIARNGTTEEVKRNDDLKKQSADRAATDPLNEQREPRKASPTEVAVRTQGDAENPGPQGKSPNVVVASRTAGESPRPIKPAMAPAAAPAPPAAATPALSASAPAQPALEQVAKSSADAGRAMAKNSEKQMARPQQSAPIEFLYVARGLSRSKADALNACLVRNGLEVSQADVLLTDAKLRNANFGSAARRELGKGGSPHPAAAPGSALAHHAQGGGRGGGAGASTQPATTPAQIVQKGDALQIRYAGNEDKKDAETETVIVAGDGTIQPRAKAAKGNALQVAGKTINEVEQALNQSAKPEGVPGAGGARVAVLSQDDDLARPKDGAEKAAEGKWEAGPRAVAAGAEALEDLHERRASAVAPTADLAPQTAPVAGELVDVVIVVQADVSAGTAPVESPTGPAIDNKAASTPAAPALRTVAPTTAPVTQPAPGAP